MNITKTQLTRIERLSNDRNLCLKLLREARQNYYKTFDPYSLYDNQKFWKKVKQLFSGTIKTTASVHLLENNEIISKDKSVAEIFN